MADPTDRLLTPEVNAEACYASTVATKGRRHSLHPIVGRFLEFLFDQLEEYRKHLDPSFMSMVDFSREIELADRLRARALIEAPRINSVLLQSKTAPLNRPVLLSLCKLILWMANASTPLRAIDAQERPEAAQHIGAGVAASHTIAAGTVLSVVAGVGFLEDIGAEEFYTQSRAVDDALDEVCSDANRAAPRPGSFTWEFPASRSGTKNHTRVNANLLKLLELRLEQAVAHINSSSWKGGDASDILHKIQWLEAALRSGPLSASFVNGGCNPPCINVGAEVVGCVVRGKIRNLVVYRALRDIPPGTELLVDYGKEFVFEGGSGLCATCGVHFQPTAGGESGGGMPFQESDDLLQHDDPPQDDPPQDDPPQDDLPQAHSSSPASPPGKKKRRKGRDTEKTPRHPSPTRRLRAPLQRRPPSSSRRHSRAPSTSTTTVSKPHRSRSLLLDDEAMEEDPNAKESDGEDVDLMQQFEREQQESDKEHDEDEQEEQEEKIDSDGESDTAAQQEKTGDGSDKEEEQTPSRSGEPDANILSDSDEWPTPTQEEIEKARVRAMESDGLALEKRRAEKRWREDWERQSEEIVVREAEEKRRQGEFAKVKRDAERQQKKEQEQAEKEEAEKKAAEQERAEKEEAEQAEKEQAEKEQAEKKAKEEEALTPPKRKLAAKVLDEVMLLEEKRNVEEAKIAGKGVVFDESMVDEQDAEDSEEDELDDDINKQIAELQQLKQERQEAKKSRKEKEMLVAEQQPKCGDAAGHMGMPDEASEAYDDYMTGVAVLEHEHHMEQTQPQEEEETQESQKVAEKVVEEKKEVRRAIKPPVEKKKRQHEKSGDGRRSCLMGRREICPDAGAGGSERGGAGRRVVDPDDNYVSAYTNDTAPSDWWENGEEANYSNYPEAFELQEDAPADFELPTEYALLSAAECKKSVAAAKHGTCSVAKMSTETTKMCPEKYSTYAALHVALPGVDPRNAVPYMEQSMSPSVKGTSVHVTRGNAVKGQPARHSYEDAALHDVMQFIEAQKEPLDAAVWPEDREVVNMKEDDDAKLFRHRDRLQMSVRAAPTDLTSRRWNFMFPISTSPAALIACLATNTLDRIPSSASARYRTFFELFGDRKDGADTPKGRKIPQQQQQGVLCGNAKNGPLREMVARWRATRHHFVTEAEKTKQMCDISLSATLLLNRLIVVTNVLQMCGRHYSGHLSATRTRQDAAVAGFLDFSMMVHDKEDLPEMFELHLTVVTLSHSASNMIGHGVEPCTAAMSVLAVLAVLIDLSKHQKGSGCLSSRRWKKEGGPIAKYYWKILRAMEDGSGLKGAPIMRALTNALTQSIQWCVLDQGNKTECAPGDIPKMRAANASLLCPRLLWNVEDILKQMRSHVDRMWNDGDSLTKFGTAAELIEHQLAAENGGAIDLNSVSIDEALVARGVIGALSEFVVDCLMTAVRSAASIAMSAGHPASILVSAMAENGALSRLLPDSRNRGLRLRLPKCEGADAGHQWAMSVAEDDLIQPMSLKEWEGRYHSNIVSGHVCGGIASRFSSSDGITKWLKIMKTFYDKYREKKTYETLLKMSATVQNRGKIAAMFWCGPILGAQTVLMHPLIALAADQELLRTSAAAERQKWKKENSDETDSRGSASESDSSDEPPQPQSPLQPSSPVSKNKKRSSAKSGGDTRTPTSKRTKKTGAGEVWDEEGDEPVRRVRPVHMPKEYRAVKKPRDKESSSSCSSPNPMEE